MHSSKTLLILSAILARKFGLLASADIGATRNDFFSSVKETFNEFNCPFLLIEVF